MERHRPSGAWEVDSVPDLEELRNSGSVDTLLQEAMAAQESVPSGDLIEKEGDHYTQRQIDRIEGRRGFTRMALIAALVAGSLGGLAEDAYGKPKEFSAKEIAKLEKSILKEYNDYRKTVGLGEVSADTDLSGSIKKHLNYIVKNYSFEDWSNPGINFHAEDSNNKYYSKEGEEAGEYSTLAVGKLDMKGENDPILALRGLLADIGHREAMLKGPKISADRDVVKPKIGLSLVIGKTYWTLGLRVDKLHSKAQGIDYEPIISPQGRNVGWHYHHEDPTPVKRPSLSVKWGMPSTVSFYDIPGDWIENPKISIYQYGKKRPIPVWFSHDEAQIAAREIISENWPESTFGVIPMRPLRRNTQYRRIIECDICPPGKEPFHYKHVDKFKTSKKSPY